MPLAFCLSSRSHAAPFPLPTLSTAAVLVATPTLVSPSPVIPRVAVSTAPLAPPPVPVPASPPVTLTMLHPLEGMKLPPLNQVFVFGAVTPGSTLTINDQPVPVHAKGGYLAMVPVISGEILLHAQVHAPNGGVGVLDRHFFISPGFQVAPVEPLTLLKGSITPADNHLLQPGDALRVSFQGSPNAQASFSIVGSTRNIPMAEMGLSTAARRGIYEGFYTVPPALRATNALVEVTLKKGRKVLHGMSAGRITIDSGEVPRAGLIVDDVVAVRTGPSGGYDLFLYKGMRVTLTGKTGGEWRVRLSSLQSGWIKESSVVPLPLGMAANHGMVTNMTIVHTSENSLIRVPLSEMLPYRVEQTLDPAQLIITLYGSTDKTDLIRHDPLDPLIRLVHWKQIAPDTTQIIIEPSFKTWWGFDVRYEGNTLTIEVRSPWTSNNLNGMSIAIDAGHGGQDTGAVGPHGTLEKEANLEIARVVRDALQKAGAQPFLTRDADIDVSLYDRPRIAWGRRARLFISIHCNASGEEENPLWNNGFSVYWYRPQSVAFADVVHASYRKTLTLPDHGIYYADLAVCRMTQMPAILTEQAYIIVPEQEDQLFDPKFQKGIATSIVNGIKALLAK